MVRMPLTLPANPRPEDAPDMTCASALSTALPTERAFEDVISRVAEGLGGETADLVVALVWCCLVPRIYAVSRGLRIGPWSTRL